VVIHRDELQPAERERLGSRDWPAAGFIERFRDERTLIWWLEPRPAPTRTEAYRVDLQAPRQVAANASVSLRLLFQVDDGTIYRDEVGGASPVAVEWRPLDRPAEPLRQTVRTALPAVVVPKPRVKAELDASAPGRPGRYRLIVSTERFQVDREVVVSGGRSG
jgi:hypothetical protein